jgi:hypothetical protein
MHSVLLNVRNSKQQYLEISNLPEHFTIWGLAVNSVPTKPLHSDNAGTLLVPLLAGIQNSNDGKSALSSVELSYLTHHTPLSAMLQSNGDGAHATLDISPPIFDIPVTRLSVELQLPTEFVANFSRNCNLPTRKCSSLAPHLPKPISRDKGKAVANRGVFDESASYAIEDQATTGSVQVQMPSSGEMYCFQRLLVTGSSARCVMDYSARLAPQQPPAPTWGWYGGGAGVVMGYLKGLL